jgi:CubicO group peptidase (beta-lactamase class C family)
MKTWKKVLLSLLLILVIAGVWFYPKIKRVYHTLHLFDEDGIVHNFRSFDEVWPVAELKASAQPHIYPKSSKDLFVDEFEYDGLSININKFLKYSWTTGFLVIQDDSIVYENYYLGNSAETKNISWSMAKSFISAMIGIAIEEGYISNIEQNIEVYLPELIGSGYEGVRIKDLLQMASGVKFDEDYADFNSDINRWGRGFALGQSQDEFAATLQREIAPGKVNHYVSINTHVLGMLLTRATGQTITAYMQEKLYTPMGMEYDGYWLVDGAQMEVALGGLNLTLKDYAKIGSLFLHNGHWNGKQIVPKTWVTESVTPDGAHVQPGDQFGYGYQWWIPKSEQGEFMAQGVYNQNIYINPTTNTVIVKLSANPFYNDKSIVASRSEAALTLFRTIANSFN